MLYSIFAFPKRPLVNHKVNDNKRRKERKVKEKIYSVLNECPHEQLLVTLGLLILKPEPIRLST